MTDSRREFLQKAAAASAIAGAGLPNVALASDAQFPFKAQGRVVKVKHSGATDKNKITRVDKDVVRRMVAQALTSLTGDSTAAQAMARFIKKDDIVGIKVNCLGSPYSSTNPETAFAIAEIVHASGVPKDNIYIYDQYRGRMTKGRMRPLEAWSKVKPDTFQLQSHKTMGYETEPMAVEAIARGNKPGQVNLAKLSRKLTAVINVPVPKDHDLTGVTGALKNVAYGSIETVPIFHCSRTRCKPVCRHDGVCNIARVYKHPEIGGKVRLIICDALRVLYHGGPQDKRWRVANNEIWASTDPVSIDRQVQILVDGIRAEKKLESVYEAMEGKRAPRFLDGAAKIGLGIGDPKKIKVETVEIS